VRAKRCTRPEPTRLRAGQHRALDAVLLPGCFQTRGTVRIAEGGGQGDRPDRASRMVSPPLERDERNPTLGTFEAIARVSESTLSLAFPVSHA